MFAGAHHHPGPARINVAIARMLDRGAIKIEDKKVWAVDTPRLNLLAGLLTRPVALLQVVVDAFSGISEKFLDEEYFKSRIYALISNRVSQGEVPDVLCLGKTAVDGALKALKDGAF